MSVAELDIRKARLARSILNEDDADVIVSLDENYNNFHKETENYAERRKKLDEFWEFIEEIRQPTPNYKFNREECYDRKVFY